MKRWLWFCTAVLISTAVYFTIRYGLRPKPIPVLNPTEFEDPQQIGAVVYKRLRQNIRPERLIVLGSSPDLQNYAAVWTGFLKTAVADQVKIDVFYQRENLNSPEAVSGWATIPFNEDMIRSGEFFKQVEDRQKAGHLVVIHAPTSEATHLMKESLSRELDRVVRHPVLALSTLNLTLKPEDLEALQAQCLDPEAEREGRARLDCAEARVSKRMIKKRLAEGKIWAVMERHGLQEYLIFVHNP